VSLYYYPRVSSIFTKIFSAPSAFFAAHPEEEGDSPQRRREFLGISWREFGDEAIPSANVLKPSWDAKKAESAEKIPLFLCVSAVSPRWLRPQAALCNKDVTSCFSNHLFHVWPDLLITHNSELKTRGRPNL
jgi:hypothetical protein